MALISFLVESDSDYHSYQTTTTSSLATKRYRDRFTPSSEIGSSEAVVFEMVLVGPTLPLVARNCGFSRTYHVARRLSFSTVICHIFLSETTYYERRTT